MRGYIIVLAAVALACQPPAESPEQAAAAEQAHADSARAAIEAGNAQYLRHINAGHADSAAMLFTADGMIMPPDVPGTAGTDSIAARFKTTLVPGGVLTLTRQNLSVSGDMALARGTWAYAAPAQGNTPAINLSGKYLEHWHFTGGQWKIAEDIWNNDAPAPQAPAPPARRN